MKLHKLSPFILLFFLIGCGYKPINQNQTFEPKTSLYVDIVVDLVDTRNSVLIKDAFLEAMAKRLGYALKNRDSADEVVKIGIKGVDFFPLLYDTRGYISIYRATIFLKIETTYRDGKSKVEEYSGRYDLNVEGDSIISDTNRFKAIKEASIKAIDKYIANRGSI